MPPTLAFLPVTTALGLPFAGSYSFLAYFAFGPGEPFHASEICSMRCGRVGCARPSEVLLLDGFTLFRA